MKTVFKHNTFKDYLIIGLKYKLPLEHFNPLKTSPEYTQAGVYGKCVLY